MKAVHPVTLVRGAPLRALLAAWSTNYPFGLIDDDSGLRTVCPRCRRHDHNGGTLEVAGAALFRCWRCGHTMNRPALERRVLEAPELLDALAAEVAP